MLAHWVWLATRPHVSDLLRRELVDRFGGAEDVYHGEKEDFATLGSLNENVLEALLDKDLSNANRILGRCKEQGIWALTWEDASYPARLRRIEDPPMVLYGLGTLPDLEDVPVIGVVGTRRASAYGLEMAREFGYQIAACGGILVSGLAAGIDGLAMEGALMASKPVVGVLGFGPDHIYPKSNKPLFEAVRRNGCLLSEYPPGIRPDKWTFPRRNRIISGLSLGVLIVEAPEKSGALITAQLAAEQGRDVYCVPGAIRRGNCAGSNALLQSRIASAVTCGYDVLEEYASLFPGKLNREQGMAPVPKAGMNLASQPVIPPKNVSKPPKQEPPTKKTIDKRRTETYIDLDKLQPTLTAQEQQLADLLRQGPKATDDVIEESGLPSSQALAVLTMLEVKGIVRRGVDRKISLAQK